MCDKMTHNHDPYVASCAHSWETLRQVIALVSFQLFSFYLLRNTRDFWTLFILAYLTGGVANHAIMLAIHEISHGMGFGHSRPVANKIFAILVNMPIGVPMSISFKKYHLEHHRYQGDEVLDTDVPTHMEAAFFTNPFKKLLWCILQPFFYTLRPLFVNPKPLDRYELINIAVQLMFDLLIVRFLGWHILAYMIGGSILAMGLHPVAGHFISEHTLMFDNADTCVIDYKQSQEDCKNEHTPNGKTCTNNEKSTENSITREKVSKTITGSTVDEMGKFLVPETCSYYGPLNWLTFNVGYHVEHHDFPSIPGSRLHKLSEIAPEFYLNINYHTSWTYVLWRYIMDPKIGPSARVRRPHGLKRP